ncbi:unnamed protein product [Cylindrotheca closterium]|uniref:5'-Nucleotidase C-terminal domain-containing protein n=1 Tax=Cylindrotheca closterium TaxID=2856 RepID=A0AAD2JL08_9STRA|nr:unnamed protein product [Cylindrotheca closterium]
MERRKSALEEAQEAALNFALDDDDDVSVISFESASGGAEDVELTFQEFTSNAANSIPRTSCGTDSTYQAHTRSSLTSPPPASTSSIKAPNRNSSPSNPSNEDKENNSNSNSYQWARARAQALASILQPGLESEDDGFSLDSSQSESSASKMGPKPPKRKDSSPDSSSNAKADEIFLQMQIQSGEFSVSRRSLPPNLTRYSSGESTSTAKSAQTIKSFPPTVKRTLSQSSYRDPRHRKNYGGQSYRSLIRPTPRPARVATRAASVGTTTGSTISSKSSSSFKASSHAAVVATKATATNEKNQEKRAISQFRQSFLRTMEERLQMRVETKERRYDEENQQQQHHQRFQENGEEQEEEEDKPPSDTEILTAETRVVPTSVDLNETQHSLAESTIPGRKLVHSVLIYSLLGTIAIATISILIVVLLQKGDNEGKVPLMEQDSPVAPVSPPTIAPEVVPDQVLAVVPKTICMEQVPGDGWSTQCSPEQSNLQGGGVCNLVAQSFLHQVEGADIAFQSSTSCLGDIVIGNFTVADAYQILPYNERLWKIEVTGFDILTVLEQVLEATFGINKGKRDYPYAAGLRFAINASAPYMHRISDLEINRRLEQYAWEPLDMDGKYTVVASRNLLIGGSIIRDTPYAAFEQAYKDQFPKGKTWRQTTTTFIEYAEKERVLRDPPLDTYSTALFVP